MTEPLKASLEAVRAALAQGDLESAHGLLDALAPDRPSVEDRLAIAAMAEEIGALHRAVHEYNLVLQADPTCLDAYARLFLLRCDLGDAGRARRCLMRWERLAPSDERLPDSRRRLHLLEEQEASTHEDTAAESGQVPARGVTSAVLPLG